MSERERLMLELGKALVRNLEEKFGGPISNDQLREVFILMGINPITYEKENI